jgi:membrane fusion protein (multidrug efflux system)
LQGSIKEAKVYVVENGMAHLNELIIGRESNGTLEVISGLEASDKVVVSGQVNLTDNRPVKIIDNR